MATTVYMAHLVLDGPLKGLVVRADVSYPTTELAAACAKRNAVGTERRGVTHRFRVVDVAFQNFWRA